MKVRVYGDVMTPERFWPVSPENQSYWTTDLWVKLKNPGYLKELTFSESERFLNKTGPIFLGDILDKFRGNV